jgi:cation-transporting ATPase 13A3/4/5
LTGKAFKLIEAAKDHDPYIFKSVLAKAQVFARMSPEDKALLVSSLQRSYLNQNIGMCGDGANDCGALKTADVGISLSEAEASIAAPFTSKVQNISCVVELLKEGKASLTTSFQAFKFIELYSLIQFFTSILCYTKGAAITDGQFLYIDLVALVPLSIFQARTGSYHKLTKDMPTDTLFYGPVLISVGVSALI